MNCGNKMEPMTGVQRRRAHSIAIARALHPGRGRRRSAVALAIVSSDWRTITRYARERLGVSQPALSMYMSGDRMVPPEVADCVRGDFGLGDEAWPCPPRRMAA